MASATDSADSLAMTSEVQPAAAERRALTPAQKVGVGAGVVAGGGLLAYAVYRVGEHFGWWPDGASGLVFDETDAEPGAEPDGDAPSEGGSKSSSGSGTQAKRARGKPPNISGDSAGYNTELFSSHAAVRIAINKLGYSVPYNGGELSPSGQANPEVRRFQSDWNKVIKGLDSGKVEFPSGAAASDGARLGYFRGLLGVDGITGRNTFNALEIAFSNQQYNKVEFHKLVKQAKA